MSCTLAKAGWFSVFKNEHLLIGNLIDSVKTLWNMISHVPGPSLPGLRDRVYSVYNLYWRAPSHALDTPTARLCTALSPQEKVRKGILSPFFFSLREGRLAGLGAYIVGHRNPRPNRSRLKSLKIRLEFWFFQMFEVKMTHLASFLWWCLTKKIVKGLNPGVISKEGWVWSPGWT